MTVVVLSNVDLAHLKLLYVVLSTLCIVQSLIFLIMRIF